MAEPVVQSIEGLTVKSTPLPPFRALDLVPEIIGLAAPGANMDSDAATFATILRGLGGGKLRELLPRILAGTKVMLPQAGGAAIEVQLDSVDGINLVFDGRMGAFPAVVGFAIRVSFADFLEGFGRAVQSFKAPAGSPSSSPST